MPPITSLPDSTDAARTVPRLALIGGRLEPNNTAVYAALRDLCGGKIAVLATASLIPEQAGADTVTDFGVHGIAAEVIPLTASNRATAAFDPALAARIVEIGSVFFTGGDQSHLIGALRQNGADTPVFTAIKTIAARGGLVSG